METVNEDKACRHLCKTWFKDLVDLFEETQMKKREEKNEGQTILMTLVELDSSDEEPLTVAHQLRHYLHTSLGHETSPRPLLFPLLQKILVWELVHSKLWRVILSSLTHHVEDLVL